MPTSAHYLSTTQAGERLGISREHVRRLIQRGELRAEETVNGFIVGADEVARFAAVRRLRSGQRAFQSTLKSLAANVRRIEGAAALGSVVTTLQNEMNVRSVFALPGAITTHVEWIQQQVAADAALAALRDPVRAMTEQWRRLVSDVRHALGNGTTDDNSPKATVVPSPPQRTQERLAGFRSDDGESGIGVMSKKIFAGPRKIEDERLATRIHDEAPSWIDPHAIARNEEMARGFVVAESYEARLEEKMDELGRKVEQLTELVLRQHTDTTTDIPTWQEWAGSDRPEDVLAKLDAVRKEVTGGKRMPENSTDIIRASREARGEEI